MIMMANIVIKVSQLWQMLHRSNFSIRSDALCVFVHVCIYVCINGAVVYFNCCNNHHNTLDVIIISFLT